MSSSKLSTTANSSLFNFKNNKVGIFTVNNEFKICLEKQSPSIATLRATNMKGEFIVLPTKLVVYDTTNSVKLKPLPNTNTYCMCWTDNYKIVYDEIVISHLINQRVWELNNETPFEIA
jgi:hypothetical protein